MVALVNYPSLISNAMIYHPYNLCYTDCSSMKWIPSQNDIEGLAKDCKTTVLSYESVPYIYVSSYAIFCVDDVNHTLGKEYTVPVGQCINIYSINLNDGYEHNVDMNLSFINLPNEKLDVKENVIDILFGIGGYPTDHVIIVNQSDYQHIKSNEGLSQNNLNLYKFTNWEKTEKMESELQKMIVKKNDLDDASSLLIESLFNSVEIAQNSSALLIFLIIYISISFLITVFILLHYKFEMEFEEDKHRFILLQAIGAENIEIKRMINDKITIIYVIPIMLANIITIIISYAINYIYGYGSMGIFYCCLVEVVLLIISFIYIRIYENYYYKRFKLFSVN